MKSAQGIGQYQSKAVQDRFHLIQTSLLRIFMHWVQLHVMIFLMRLPLQRTCVCRVLYVFSLVRFCLAFFCQPGKNCTWVSHSSMLASMWVNMRSPRPDCFKPATVVSAYPVKLHDSALVLGSMWGDSSRIIKCCASTNRNKLPTPPPQIRVHDGLTSSINTVPVRYTLNRLIDPWKLYQEQTNLPVLIPYNSSLQ